MTGSRLDIDQGPATDGVSQLLTAVIAALVVLVVGLLLTLATAPKKDASPTPRRSVTSSTPVLTPASDIG